jgi:hypothetical protein
LKSPRFWDIAPRHWVIDDRNFGTPWWYHIQGLNSSCDISTLEDEATMVFQNFGHKSAPQFRRKKTSASF